MIGLSSAPPPPAHHSSVWFLVVHDFPCERKLINPDFVQLVLTTHALTCQVQFHQILSKRKKPFAGSGGSQCKLVFDNPCHDLSSTTSSNFIPRKSKNILNQISSNYVLMVHAFNCMFIKSYHGRKCRHTSVFFPTRSIKMFDNNPCLDLSSTTSSNFIRRKNEIGSNFIQLCFDSSCFNLSIVCSSNHILEESAGILKFFDESGPRSSQNGI